MIVVKAGDSVVELPAKDLRLSRLVSYAAERKFKFGMFEIYWVKNDSTETLIPNQDSLATALEGPMPKEILIRSTEHQKKELKGGSLFDRLRNFSTMSQAQSAFSKGPFATRPHETLIQLGFVQETKGNEVLEVDRDSRASSAETALPCQQPLASQEVWTKEHQAGASLTAVKQFGLREIDEIGGVKERASTTLDRMSMIDNESTLQLNKLAHIPPLPIEQGISDYSIAKASSRFAVTPLPMSIVVNGDVQSEFLSSPNSVQIIKASPSTSASEPQAKKRKRCCVLL